MRTHTSFLFIGMTAIFLTLVGIFGFVFFARPVPIALEPISQQVIVPSPNTPLSSSATTPASSTVSQPTSPDVSTAPTATLLFVGDIMLDRNVRARSVAAGSRAYPFAKLASDWFNQADYTIANLEGPITDRRREPVKSIDFQFDPEVIPALQATGIDAFSQANNHALDQGAAGYADSIQRLRQAGFLVFGHQVQDDDISFATTTVKGISIAFLGFNVTDNPLDRLAAARAIEHARAQASVVLIYMHWGQEYQDHPTGEQIELAHWFIDRGVSAVLGGHPHWVQGLSLYQGKPIAWSMGNFIFDQDFSVETRQGMALKFTIDAERVLAIEPIPVQINLSQPTVVEGEARQARLRALAAISDANLRASLEMGVWDLSTMGTSTISELITSSSSAPSVVQP